MAFITNSFSINMIASMDAASVKFTKISAADVPQTVESALGHADIATVVSADLGITLPVNRVSNSLQKGDVIYVAQYVGPRLPEGAVALPEGATINYYKVEVLAD